MQRNWYGNNRNKSLSNESFRDLGGLDILDTKSVYNIRVGHVPSTRIERASSFQSIHALDVETYKEMMNTSTDFKNLSFDTSSMKNVYPLVEKEDATMRFSSTTPKHVKCNSYISPLQSFMQTLLTVTEVTVPFSTLRVDDDPIFTTHRVIYTKCHFDDATDDTSDNTNIIPSIQGGDSARSFCYNVGALDTLDRDKYDDNNVQDSDSCHNYDDMPPLIDIGREMRSFM